MRFVFAACFALAPPLAPAADPKPTAAQLEYFEAKVRPVLAEHCYSCHGPKKQSAGLRLDTAAGLRAGADNGPVLVPGDPAKSRLVKSVKREGDYAMPPKAPLPADAVAVLAEWVKGGGAMPDDIAQGPTTDPKKHWAFQPVKEPAIPAGAANPIDALVSSKLRDKGLALAPRADKRALARRAYYDLTGLPPTAEQLEAFEKDVAPDAWEKLIDALLASPQYGERWGRHWLDVARYADTKGYVFQEERAFAFSYTYRNYVIKAFNDDKPYDQFVTEQLAADLLPDAQGKNREALAAMGFLTLGRRFLSNQQDIIDDRIDVVTRGFMGLTVTCARCHDHKYDPVPTKDYYSLYGVFASTKEPGELPLIGEVKRTPEVIAFEEEVAKREAAIDAERAKRHTATLAKLRSPQGVGDYLRALLDLRGKPNEELQNALRQRDLNRLVFDRWRDFVQAQVKAKSNVFVPLLTLGMVPEKEFAEEWAAALPKETSAPLRGALEAAKPKTLKDALDAVAKALTAPPPVGPVAPEQAELFAWRANGGPTDIALADFEKIYNRADRDALAALRKKVDAFKASSPHAPPRAHVLYDSAPVQPVVFLRGNPGNRGPVVPRQAPEISTPNRKPFTQGSGRLELARTIASADNPLTARVFVNRVWLGHFGHGLVRTPSDFGVRSDAPVHPELLDWLAATFVKDGWSVKRLHKRIMLSATYQQSSATSEAAYKLDPENQLLARQNRRRLDFESLRDSLLFASGKLDLTPGGKPVDLFKAPFAPRRTVYGLIDRTSLPSVFRAFDAANPDTHTPQRFQTTVPQQALFLMNGPFVQEQSKALAARVTDAKAPAEKVKALYRAALGRAPTKAELELATEFVGDDDGKAAFGRWPQLAQVLLLSNEFAFVD
jgi:cytochrome c553